MYEIVRRVRFDRETPSGETNEIMLPSRAASQRHLLDLHEALAAVRREEMPPMHSVAWPQGLDRSVLTHMELSVRTRNVFRATGLTFGDNALTVRYLLGFSNFGRKSLTDFLLGLEFFLRECIRIDTGNSAQVGNSRTEPEEADFHPRPPKPPLDWERAGELLGPLVAASVELYGSKSLSSVLHPDVLQLASRLGLSSSLEAFDLSPLVEASGGPVFVLSCRLEAVLKPRSLAEEAILHHRILNAPAKTLQEVASMVGVTRERIRQIQQGFERRIREALGKELRALAFVLKEEFGHWAPTAEVERRVGDLLSAEPDLIRKVLRQALLDEMEFRLMDDVYFDTETSNVVQKLKSLVRELADDAGLVREEQLLAKLPDEGWHSLWPWIRSQLGLHEFYGMLSLRNSTKARAKAALISIGHPATREEVARVCGLDETRIGAQLSLLPSVVRASKERWGLTEWVDDEYDGIVGEILQRIKEDGGATTTERLLSELPSKFNVSPNSVRAYMQSPKFAIRDGWISLAKTSALQLRHLDDVVHGHSSDGHPYWSFVVDARFLDGYSVTGVPPEFAKALGCEPDGKLCVRVANLVGCRDLSLSWRLSSITGASFGYLARPLTRLGLQPGQRARVTIKGPGLVDLNPDYLKVDSPSPSDADVKLAQIMNRRRAL